MVVRFGQPEMVLLQMSMTMTEKLVKIDWDVFELYTTSLISKLKEDPPVSLIVGLSRGGLPLATTLSNRLGIPLMCIEWSLRDGKIRDIPELAAILETEHGKEILIVDDLIDSGSTFKDIHNTMNSEIPGIWDKVTVTPTVLLYNTEAFTNLQDWNKPVSAVKFQRSSYPHWFCFPWE